MENQRPILLIAFLAISFFIWQTWNADKNQPEAVAAPVVSQDTASVPGTDTVTDSAIPEASAHSAAPAVPVAAETIRVVTDALDMTIDLNGGDVTHAALSDFPVERGSETPVVILERSPEHFYVAQSGLVGVDRTNWRPTYQTTGTTFAMAEGSDTLSIPLTTTTDDGLKVTKTFTFKRGSHAIDVSYAVENTGTTAHNLRLWGMLRQSAATSKKGTFFMPTYSGAAYSTADKRYEKLKFEKLGEDKIDENTQGGWVAMIQHYFVSAWVPKADQQNNLYSGFTDGQGRIGFMGPAATVEPGQSSTFDAVLFVGPKDQDVLSGLSPSLNLVVDYGFLWWIAQPLHWLLTFFHNLVGNWGLAIILITITVKGAMYKLTKAQYTSMAKMRLLQPKIAALKERFGEDRQKMSQAMMEMYKKEKVNPLGGCLPIVLQMPIFIALYWVLVESVELRQAPFMLWIQDLSVKDPYYVLPILMGLSMWLSQRMSPMTVTDPMQAKMMQWMPAIMTTFFLMFPSGLVLYWFASNLINIAQQWMINRGIEKQGLKAANA